MMRRLFHVLLLVGACWFAAYAAEVQQLQLPERIGAGTEISFSAPSDGELIIIGPAAVIRRDVRSGEQIRLSGDEVSSAGRYLVLLRGDDQERKGEFYVTSARPEKISFVARPSRVPVSRRDAISGVTFIFDQHDNLVLHPVAVEFAVSLQGAGSIKQKVSTQGGIAFVRLPSGSREGAAQFVALVNGVSEKRVVRQVASDPCALSMRAQRSKEGVQVETAPIRDCSGNSLPDGTIVTFTAVTPDGRRSTIDARMKRGVARATFPALAQARLSVASGVVMGNEVSIGGGR
jgi:hypothetical protein